MCCVIYGMDVCPLNTKNNDVSCYYALIQYHDDEYLIYN